MRRQSTVTVFASNLRCGPPPAAAPRSVRAMKVSVGFTSTAGEGCPSFGGQRTVCAVAPFFNASAQSARLWGRCVNRQRVATANPSFKRTPDGAA